MVTILIGANGQLVSHLALAMTSPARVTERQPFLGLSMSQPSASA
jgi:hypothetical protein